MANSPADKATLWEGRLNITPSPVNAMLIYMTTNKHMN
jgi:hypothetical protein